MQSLFSRIVPTFPLGVIGIVVSCLILAACGSGVSDDDHDNGAALEVISTNPDDDSSGQPTTLIIRAFFNRDLDPASVTQNRVRLFPDGSSVAVAAEVSYDAALQAIQLIPDSELLAGTQYLVEVDPDIRAEDGQTLGLLFTWTFATAVAAGPPQVIATTPSDGQTDVGTATIISATFDRPMDPGTLTTDTVTVEGGGVQVSGLVAYHSASNSVSFTPDANLEVATEYVVLISSSVSDTHGNSMATGATWSFTTGLDAIGDGDWQLLGARLDPEGLDPGDSVDATMMLIAGQPYVGYRHALTHAVLQRWQDGAGWSDPLGGEPTAGRVRAMWRNPTFIAIGNAVFLSYSRRQDGSTTGASSIDRVFVYRWTATTGWSIWNNGEEISTPYSTTLFRGADAREPMLARSQSGLPLATWVETDILGGFDAEDAAWIAEVSATGSMRYGPWQRDNSQGNYGSPVRLVAVGSNPANSSHYLAHWESDDADPTRTNLYVSGFSGSSFSTLGGIVATDHSSGARLSHPSIASDSGGYVHVAYSATDSSGQQRVWVQRWNGASWSPLGSAPVSLLSTPAIADNPQLLLINGYPVLAWDEQGPHGGSRSIYIAYWDAGSWHPLGQAVEIDRTRDAVRPSLAFDGADNRLYVAFQERTASGDAIFVRRRELPSSLFPFVTWLDQRQLTSP